MSAPLPHRVDAFGLRFACGFECPGAAPGEGSCPPDVWAAEAATPASLGERARHGHMFEAMPDRLLLKTRLTADFLVADGRRVDVSFKPGADPVAFANLLFGWVSGGLLMQRGVLALHGGAVATAAGAAVFCGDSGVGKSTLVTQLLRFGFPVIDDNIIALDMASPALLAQPGLGSVRLMRDTLDLLGWPVDAAWPLSPIKSKFLVSLPASRRCRTPVPVLGIYFLRRTAQPECVAVAIAERPRLLQAHTFMGRFAPGLGKTQDLFRLWLRVAAEIPMYHLGVPADRCPVRFAEDVASRLS